MRCLWLWLLDWAHACTAWCSWSHVTLDTGGHGSGPGTVASVSAGCDQSRPRNVCSRYTNTTWTPRTTTSFDHLLNWILLPKVTDVVVVKNIWEDEDDDNGLWMTAAARDKDSFCWRPWSGCCWGWSPPASPGGKAGKGWAGREAGGWGLEVVKA